MNRGLKGFLGFLLGAFLGFLVMPVFLAIQNFDAAGGAAAAATVGPGDVLLALILAAFGGLIGTIIGSVS